MAGRERHLLSQPAATVVRHLARELQEEAQAAALRLARNEPEALHDFRVAVRRLRTLLRAYRDLEIVPVKLNRKLRALARATNEARDLEVALSNLRTFAGESSPAMAATNARLTERLACVYPETLDEVRRSWPRLALRLRAHLERETDQPVPTFRQSAARLLVAEWAQLLQWLDALRSDWQDDAAHRARLAGKRLRYLLEPLAGEEPAAREAVTALKTFQDAFGLYRDLWLLLELVAEFAAGSAAIATRARVCGHLSDTLPVEHYLALAECLRAERCRIAERLRADYLEPGSAALRPVATAVEALSAP